MTPDEYRQLDAVAIDELVGTKQVRPDEFAALAAEVHHATADATNAVVEWYEDPTLPINGYVTDPALRGVPMLRKDYGSAEAGRLVEMGSRLAAGNRATTTAGFIIDLMAAGAQILGRSAVPEFIQHGVTESRVHGVTRNPWDLAVSAGGSSGGAAAAVAAGVVPIAHASDCAGSIRIPAATCGLVGLKPGRQRVPWPGQDWNGIAQEFIVCRSVRDAQRGLDVLGRGDYEVPPIDMSIGISTDHWAGVAADPTIVRVTEQIGELLTSMRHMVSPIEPPVDYELLMQTWPTAFSMSAQIQARWLADKTGRPIDATTVEPMTLASFAAVNTMTDDERTAAYAARVEVVRHLHDDLRHQDVILTPTLGRVTIPVNTVGGEAAFADYGPRNDEIFPYNYLFNLAGWPSINIPAGFDTEGHPIGVQLSARVGGESLLLTLAAQIESARPWPMVAPWPLRSSD